VVRKQGGFLYPPWEAFVPSVGGFLYLRGRLP